MSTQRTSDKTLTSSRREFLGTVVTASAGALTCAFPAESRAFTVEGALAAGFAAVYAIGKFKSLLVDVLGNIKKPGTPLAERFDAIAWNLYGANYAEFSPKGNPFHMKYAFNHAPNASYPFLDAINVDGEGNGFALPSRALARFLPGVGFAASGAPDFNLSEVSFAAFMLKKNKAPINKLFITSLRQDVMEKNTKAGSRESQPLRELLKDRLRLEFSPDTVTQLEKNFTHSYVRTITESAQVSTTFGVGYFQPNLRKSIYFTFGGSKSPPGEAERKENSSLVSEHIENVLAEPSCIA